MAEARTGGPLGTRGDSGVIDSGSLVRMASPRPGVVDTLEDDRRLLDHAIQALEAEIANAGTHLALDAQARQAYSARIRELSRELHAEAAAGRISWRAAAERAHGLRNEVMDIIRTRSTPVGRARAQALKREGKTLNRLIAEKTVALFGEGADFARLSEAQQGRVYAEIVKSAGKSNERVNLAMRRASRAGRGLLLLSVAVSIYEVANAEDKIDAAKREATVTGAGIAGGIAGGALAGLACGPGAPVCVTIGAFVGGALAAFGADWAW